MTDINNKTVTGVLLDPSPVHSFLDSAHFPWTQLLEVVYSARSDLRSRENTALGLDEVSMHFGDIRNMVKMFILISVLNIF